MGTMNPEKDFLSMDITEGGDVLVKARWGTIGDRWPMKIEFRGETYLFACNELLTANAECGGMARYRKESPVEIGLTQSSFEKLHEEYLAKIKGLESSFQYYAGCAVTNSTPEERENSRQEALRIRRETEIWEVAAKMLLNAKRYNNEKSR